MHNLSWNRLLWAVPVHISFCYQPVQAKGVPRPTPLLAALQPVKNGTKGQASLLKVKTSTSRGTMAMLFFVQHTLKMLCVYDMPREEESAIACWVLPSLTKDLTEWATMEVMYANPFRVS